MFSYVVGVDPGFASLGVGVLRINAESPPGTLPEVVEAYVATTQKSRRARRITDDDVRRMQALWLNIFQTIDEYKPQVIGVECYTVYKPTQGGHAGKGSGWKALFAYAMTCAVGFGADIPVLAFTPTELKRGVCGRPDADKLDVEQGLYTKVSGLQQALAGLPAGMHEHAADAVGHAYLALAATTKGVPKC